ncbi:MAG: helix-turn-helix domain-containing protein [Acetatifactor sp.]|nr:helix-turn-helix domain-containing protein [Acetatifactor sp.]
MSKSLLISEAAKEVDVESHVLRYWEEELHLMIHRNNLGHRYYTEEDIARFKKIKAWKERGLQLKAIKVMMKKDGTMAESEVEYEELPGEEEIAKGMREIYMEEKEEKAEGQALAIDIVDARGTSAISTEEKARRLKWLFQQMVKESLEENNKELCREIKDSVVKELDYQFRVREEREEARDRMLAERDERYYRKMDELLRKKSRKLFGSEKKRKGAS